MSRSKVADILENRTVARNQTKLGHKWSITVTGQQNQVAVVELINYFLLNAGTRARIKRAQDMFVWMPNVTGQNPKIIALNTLVQNLNANQTIFKFSLKYQTILQITELAA